jgi:hypothetical protein
LFDPGTFESAVFFVGKSKIMGNCCSDVASGAGATAGVGGSGSSAALGATNDALDYYLKSKGFNGLFSQIELSFSASNLRDRDVLSKVTLLFKIELVFIAGHFS